MQTMSYLGNHSGLGNHPGQVNHSILDSYFVIDFLLYKFRITATFDKRNVAVTFCVRLCQCVFFFFWSVVTVWMFRIVMCHANKKPKRHDYIYIHTQYGSLAGCPELLFSLFGNSQKHQLFQEVRRGQPFPAHRFAEMTKYAQKLIITYF